MARRAVAPGIAAGGGAQAPAARRRTRGARGGGSFGKRIGMASGIFRPPPRRVKRTPVIAPRERTRGAQILQRRFGCSYESARGVVLLRCFCARTAVRGRSSRMDRVLVTG